MPILRDVVRGHSSYLTLSCLFLFVFSFLFNLKCNSLVPLCVLSLFLQSISFGKEMVPGEEKFFTPDKFWWTNFITTSSRPFRKNSPNFSDTKNFTAKNLQRLRCHFFTSCIYLNGPRKKPTKIFRIILRKHTKFFRHKFCPLQNL